MKDKVKFTIVTVTYNATDTIERTLNSVERQTYPVIEHVLIDGCSQDDTMVHIQRYVERNNNPRQRTIKVVREPDNGLYDAMNKAIAIAEGDYIVFLNAGDTLHDTTTLEQMAEKIDWLKDSVNYAVVYGETDLVDAEGNFVRHRRLSVPQELTADSFRSGMLVCHQSFYVRMDIAKMVTYDLTYRFSADFDWCVRVLRLAARRRQKNLNTGLILTNYLAEGMTTQNHRQSLLERFNIMSRHYGLSVAIGQHLWFVLRSIIKR